MINKYKFIRFLSKDKDIRDIFNFGLSCIFLIGLLFISYYGLYFIGEYLKNNHVDLLKNHNLSNSPPIIIGFVFACFIFIGLLFILFLIAIIYGIIQTIISPYKLYYYYRYEYIDLSETNSETNNKTNNKINNKKNIINCVKFYYNLSSKDYSKIDEYYISYYHICQSTIISFLCIFIPIIIFFVISYLGKLFSYYFPLLELKNKSGEIIENKIFYTLTGILVLSIMLLFCIIIVCTYLYFCELYKKFKNKYEEFTYLNK